MNTFFRCHSTVRELMNSSVPISAFVRPVRASRAICSSCGVSSSSVSTRRLRTGWPVASSSRRARGESIRANRVEHFVSRMQLLARFDSAALATQPLPVEQLPAREFHAQAGASPAQSTSAGADEKP